MWLDMKILSYRNKETIFSKNTLACDFIKIMKKYISQV